jgi:hypothetical protein
LALNVALPCGTKLHHLPVTPLAPHLRKYKGRISFPSF